MGSSVRARAPVGAGAAVSMGWGLANVEQNCPVVHRTMGPAADRRSPLLGGYLLRVPTLLESPRTPVRMGGTAAECPQNLLASHDKIAAVVSLDVVRVVPVDPKAREDVRGRGHAELPCGTPWRSAWRG